MHSTVGVLVLFLCAAAVHSAEEDYASEVERRDCESMTMCNLTDAVPGSDVKFSDLNLEEKIRVCSSLKNSLDCSSLHSCGRLVKFAKVAEQFFNFVCKKIFTENGISTENCYKEAHQKAINKCSNHLEKMKSLANEATGNEVVRVACCEHHNYSKCYREEVSSKCNMDRSFVAVHSAPNFEEYCLKWTPTKCREQRDLKPNSMGVSSAANLSCGMMSLLFASFGLYFAAGR